MNAEAILSELDSIDSAHISGEAGFSVGRGIKAAMNQSLDFHYQHPSGNVADETDEHLYIALVFSSDSDGTGSLHVDSTTELDSEGGAESDGDDPYASSYSDSGSGASGTGDGGADPAGLLTKKIPVRYLKRLRYDVAASDFLNAASEAWLVWEDMNGRRKSPGLVGVDADGTRTGWLPEYS